MYFGTVASPSDAETLRFPVTAPTRLSWELSDGARAIVREAHESCAPRFADLQLCVISVEGIGKGFAKRHGIAPDAFCQLALQLAYFFDSDGRYGLVYESAMTRLFGHGRTETIRSTTPESTAFVHAAAMMRQGDAGDRLQALSRLHAAAESHQLLSREAITGGGVDRHLFALLVCARATGTESHFLSQALSMPWVLSTSQQPQQQTEMWDPFRCVAGRG
jgi:carnitine O-palmitoyltransferase 1